MSSDDVSHPASAESKTRSSGLEEALNAIDISTADGTSGEHTEEKKERRTRRRDPDLSQVHSDGTMFGTKIAALSMMSQQRWRPIAHAHVTGIRFAVNSPDDVRQTAVTEVINKNITQNDLPVFGGVYDPNLGSPDKWKCVHCKNAKPKCLGHFGYMTMKYPLPSMPAAIKTVVHYAKVICHSCGAFMLGDKRITGIKREKLLEKYASVSHVKKKKDKDSAKQIKVNDECPKCGAPHPVVQINTATIARRQFHTVLKQIMYAPDGTEIETALYYHKLLEAFNRVSDETVAILGKPLSSHPRNLVSYYLPVCSNIIRPDKKVMAGNRSGSDDLTKFYKLIMELNLSLPDIIPDVINSELAEKYFELGERYYGLNMSSADSNAARGNQSLTAGYDGIAGRIPLKKGRIRNDLMGGRSFLTGRSVISGDPRLPLHVLGMPFFMARRFYHNMVVCAANYNEAMIYFKNGVTVYPGARWIIKGSTGTKYNIESLKDDATIEIGDTIRRDFIDGDVIMFGRQPALWCDSIRGFNVRIMYDGDTLRLNPCICVFFNADFDGDEMFLIAPSHLSTSIEIDMYANISSSATSHQDGGPMAGMFQNSLWSIAKLTTAGVSISRDIMMDMISMVPDRINIASSRRSFTGREAVSFIIPEKISMRATPMMYNPNAPARWDPSDISVEIKNGQLLSGVLDKATIGQRKAGSLFHKITHLYGPRKSNAVVYAMQQMAESFIAQYGSTVHLGDFLVSPDAQKAIQCQTENLIARSIQFHDEYRLGECVPPLDMTAAEFHERQQLEILQLVEHKAIITADLDINKNNLKHANEKCGKGDPKNTEATLAAVGQQSIRGERLGAGSWRASAYYPYFSSDPRSRGFIASPYIRGLTVPEQLAMAEDVRHQLIQIQLSTATAGHAARETMKGLELIVIDPYRRVMKQNQYVIQSLYGGTGLDIRNIIYSDIKHISLSNERFEVEYLSRIADFGITDNLDAAKILCDEFARIASDRAFYRASAMAVESEYMDPRLMKSKVVVGFDIDSIILTTINLAAADDNIESKSANLDPIAAVETLERFCENLPYVFSNQNEYVKHARVPDAYHTAVISPIMLLRDRLCVKQLARLAINNILLDTILEQVFIRFKQSLADGGLAVGPIASESLGEMYTQFMLDSKHRQAGSLTDKLRGIEIIIARGTAGMKNAKMLLHVLPKYQKDREKVTEIASKLEVIRMDQFIENAYQFGGERFGAPKHALLLDQAKYIEEMKKYQSIHVPADLSLYVILFQLNIDQMIQRYLTLDVIVRALQVFNDRIFIVHSPETMTTPTIACYVRLSALTGAAGHRVNIDNLEEEIRSTVLRGVSGIISASVTEFTKTVVAPDGSLETDTVFAIRTRGTNLKTMLQIEELDARLCQTNSIHEMADVLGIIPAYRKLITEMRVSFSGPAYAHFTIFASEMCFTGMVTGITKAGASLRNNDVLPRASHISPIPTIVEAAINGVENKIRGASASLMLGGTIADIGTTASKIIIDEDAIHEMQSAVDDLL
jgi:DNA-directed RNA polymerase II subunit RPB1